MSKNSDGDAPRLSRLLIYLKGVYMGAVDAAPGVSGGTVALITDIYERLINVVTVITPGRIKHTLGVVVSGRRADTVAAMREVDVDLLLALGAGITTTIVTVMRALHITLNDAPVPTYGFLFGLIAASAVVLYAQVSLDGLRQVAVAIAGSGLVFVASGGSDGAFGHSLLAIAVAGGIAVSAMILPDVSGSLILLILGQYKYMNAALNAFIDSLLDVAGDAPLSVVVEPGTVVVTLMVGAVVNLFSIAHAVRWALEHYRRATLAFLVNLIVGALRAPAVESTAVLVDTGRSWTTELYATFTVATVVGAVVVLLAGRYTGVIESRARIGATRRSGVLRRPVRRKSVSRPNR